MLPLLDYTYRLFKNQSLENVFVIGVQHILETNLEVFNTLFKMGLEPRNTCLLGKCYSTNKIVFNEFVQLGVNIDAGSFYFDSHVSFDELFEKQVDIFVARACSKNNLEIFRKVIIIDDGGQLIQAMNKLKQDKSNFIGIEQTSAGYHRLKKIQLSFPVINVARSRTKLETEPVFLAELISCKIKESLDQLNLAPRKALVIGGGVVGIQIHNRIRDWIQTDLYDKVPDRSAFGKHSLQEIIGNYDLVIGATGNTVLDANAIKRIRNNAVLASASSSDREFHSVAFRKNYPRHHDCHSNLKTNNGWLLNAGFPLNFNGEKNSIAAGKIQITRALMFAAVCLAVPVKSDRRITELDDPIQSLLLSEFYRIHPIGKKTFNN